MREEASGEVSGDLSDKGFAQLSGSPSQTRRIWTCCYSGKQAPSVSIT